MNKSFEIKISDEKQDDDWDAFVNRIPCGDHVQTSLWAKVKSSLGYRALRIIVSRDEQIIAGGQILLRKIAPFLNIGYMPKGPLFSTWDPMLGEILLGELMKIVQTNHLILLAVQPASEVSELSSLFFNYGFQQSWLELAPTATIIVDLIPELDQITSKMKRQTRQNIRRSEREGITVREGTETDLSTFYQLHLVTSKRQKFRPYPEEYFAQMWKSFAAHRLISLMLAEYQGECVSALLLVSFRDTVFAKTLGWSGHFAERRPNDALFWGSIQWAKNNGHHYFDFEGIDRRGAGLMSCGLPLPEALQHTPDFLKLGYGGKVVLRPQSCYLVSNSIRRWPHHLIFGLDKSDSPFKHQFEHIRRRFG